ncbi:glycoside hydrolase family 2 TIM barrel-domain containing protein [Melioribacteraceae bacterium 4301-Me]|uniref:glycoside hydrolase family 2 TIM barrel-domain containing protein n=1 Tax=Pyranulibacter aquaticus TaxID=3163344 RepID=UPI00359AABF4
MFLFVFLSIPHSHLTAQTASLEATLKLQNVNGIMIPYQNGFPLPSFEKQNRQIIDLKGTWKKQRFSANSNISLAKRDQIGIANLEAEALNRYKTDYDDSAWETKELPSVENTINQFPTRPDIYQDGVWYRKSFYVDQSLSNKFIKLIFYSVNYVADVWINGKYVGYHEGGYTPFAFDVSDKLNYGGSNVIAVRVDNPAWNTRNDIVPFVQCDWFNYTGIIHDVYLEVTDKISIIRADVVPIDTAGGVKIKIVSLNKTQQAVNLSYDFHVYEARIDSDNITSEYAKDLIGKEVPIAILTSSAFTIIPPDSVGVYQNGFAIFNPKLWTPKNPNLYILKISLVKDDVVLDEYYTQFGIRTAGTQGNKLLLNNRVMFFTGAARHEDHPNYGRSIPKNVIYNDLKIVKSLNINFLRTAHYPNHPFTYLLTDRMGIAVMEEIPVYWFNNATEWQIQNNIRHIHQQMFREMVFRDYNRPSILLWSTSNECKDVANRKIYNANIVSDVRNNYNDGRLITQSAAADSPGSNDDTQQPLDAAGWTMYFGVFYGTPFYRVGSINSETVKFLLDAKNNFPNKPIINTEFGYWSTENNSTTNDQITVFNQTFNAFTYFSALDKTNKINQNGCLAVSTWWCVFDWYRHDNPGGYQSMGLYSMDRTIAKPVAEILKNAYQPYYDLEGVLTEVKDEKGIKPNEFLLKQNYPNPFNPSTIIGYQLPNGSFVTLKVYDILGREIVTLINEYKPAGEHKVKFNAANLPTGVYFYKFTAGDKTSVKKMILLK